MVEKYVTLKDLSKAFALKKKKFKGIKLTKTQEDFIKNVKIGYEKLNKEMNYYSNLYEKFDFPYNNKITQNQKIIKKAIPRLKRFYEENILYRSHYGTILKRFKEYKTHLEHIEPFYRKIKKGKSLMFVYDLIKKNKMLELPLKEYKELLKGKETYMKIRAPMDLYVEFSKGGKVKRKYF